MTSTSLDDARTALAAAREKPNLALETAAAVLAQAPDDDETRATAHFAIGLAQRALASGRESTAHLERAASLTVTHDGLRGRILRSLAFNYAQAGKLRLADATVGESIALLSGQERDLSVLQQAFMLLMRGDLHGAFPVLTEAVAAFTISGDDDYLELTLFNRALIHMEFGDYDSSINDLHRAFDIAVRLDHLVSAADAALHMSQVMGWRDDVPAAMEWHARSVELRTTAGAPNPVADAEHAFVLIRARLMSEAEEVLRSSIPRLLDAGDNDVAVQSYLLLADVLSHRGAHEEAAAQVEMARRASPPDGRYRFDIAAADHQSRIVAGEATPALLRSMLATAADMEANGELHAAAVERLRAVTVALRLDEPGEAARLCGDRHVLRSGPLWLQIQAWTALAEVRTANGDRRGAAAAARAGFRRLDEYRATIGATDLRIRASEFGVRLADVGVGLAVAAGSPARVFHWSERLRSSNLMAGRKGGPDPELGDALARLRRATSQVHRANPQDAPKLQRAQRLQERRIRDLSHRTPGTATSFHPATLAAVQAQLGNRLLLEYTELHGRIGAVVVTAESTELVDLGATDDARGLVDHLRFAGERIARPSTSGPSRLAALASAAEIAAEIRDTLIDPIDKHDSPASLVIMPSGALRAVPWGLVVDGLVEVAPSATSWLRAGRVPLRGGPNLVVTGPDLAHAATEAGLIADLAHAEAVATVAASVRKLPHAAMAHFACHARTRLDSPMFSSLLLHDGELTLYDIERMPHAPATVVLAACEGGSAVMATGDEVMGLAEAFLALGARNVVAPVFSVSDEATAAVMVRFHELFGSGTDPATALAAIARIDDPVARFTAQSFTCFGAA